MRRSLTPLVLAACLFAGPAPAARARNVDLVTLPPRDAVQLTIYNAEDLTLVRERRSITFKKGLNRLQFSWANTLIDPTSVHFRPVEHDDRIEVLDTTFPADRPQVLVWNVESEIEGQVPVEVQYFTSGISWAADYVMLTDPGETAMDLTGYVTVTNQSGEDYEGAEVRLIVGVVNLVEKIRELAQGGIGRELAGGMSANGRKLDRDAVYLGLQLTVDECDFTTKKPKAPPQVMKEGLSEYFLFTVEGTQTVKNGWSQRMRSFRAEDVPFEILYRYRAHQYGDRPVRFFILANDEEHKMGESPLPDGVIRVFRRNERDGLGYYTTQSTKYIPLKEKIELNVGTDDELVYERVIFDVERDGFIFDEKPRVPQVIGWNERQTWQEEVRNYRAKPVILEIRHQIPGDVAFALEDSPRAYDYRTVEYTVTVKPGETRTWTSAGLFRLGRNKKQDRVEIVARAR